MPSGAKNPRPAKNAPPGIFYAQEISRILFIHYFTLKIH